MQEPLKGMQYGADGVMSNDDISILEEFTRE
jgi:hypothetical protein